MDSRLGRLACAAVWFFAQFGLFAGISTASLEKPADSLVRVLANCAQAAWSETLLPRGLRAGISRQFAAGTAADAQPLPARLISAQLSRDLAEQWAQGAVESTETVGGVLFGAKIDGQAHLQGSLRLAFTPSPREIRCELVFTGTCQTVTQGSHSVVALYNTADTEFEARKRFVWNSKAFTYSPAVAVAETQSRTDGITTSLPGMFGGIARQTARNRVAQLRPLADDLVSRQAATRIQETLDARVEVLSAALGDAWRDLPATAWLKRSARIKLSCTRDTVNLLVVRRDARLTPELTRMPALPRDCDLSVDISSGLVRECVRDPLALWKAVSTIQQLLATECPAGGQATREPASAWRISRSPDHERMMVQHLHAKQIPPPPGRRAASR